MEKSCLRYCLRQEIICNSGRQQIKFLTKIATDNALEYLASGKNFNEDRLTGSNFWSSEDGVCSVDNKFSVISVWLILLLGIVKTELFTMSSLLRNIYVTLKNVCSKLPWKYQGYHQEMEISGICNPYDYLM